MAAVADQFLAFVNRWEQQKYLFRVLRGYWHFSCYFLSSPSYASCFGTLLGASSSSPRVKSDWLDAPYWLGQQLRRRTLAQLLRLPSAVSAEKGMVNHRNSCVSFWKVLLILVNCSRNCHCVRTEAFISLPDSGVRNKQVNRLLRVRLHKLIMVTARPNSLSLLAGMLDHCSSHHYWKVSTTLPFSFSPSRVTISSWHPYLTNVPRVTQILSHGGFHFSSFWKQKYKK